MKKTSTINRLLSLVLCICMVLSLVPGYALPALAEEAEPTCSCSVKCTEGSVNSGCPVCSAEGADLSGVCTAEPANAEDGVVEVSTETELIAALENGGNIMLTGDITVSDEYPFSYDITKNTAINLNGHTITGEGVFCLSGHEENIVLTISGNGTVKNTNPNFTSAIHGFGTLNMLGGTIEGGTNIFGPTIMSDGWVDELHTDKHYSDEDTSSITGGYVGTLNCWGGILTISGGHVEALGIKYGRIIISGGTFGFDPTAYLAEGYTATEADGKWVVTCANGCEYTYSDNGDGTHTATCSVCGHKVTEEHSTEKEENKANCQQGDICDLCGESYGELGGHTAEPTYAPTADGSQHVATYSCCDTTVTEEHTIENHVCTFCGAMEIVVSFDAGDYEWKTGETLYFCRVSRDNEWEEYCFTATVDENGAVTWTPDKTLYWDGMGEHKLIISYPANMGLGWDDFAIPTDQSDAEKLKAADCMNARWVGTPTTNVIEFELKHRMAKITVEYVLASQFDGSEDVTAQIHSNAKYCIFSDADGLPMATSVGQYDAWVTPHMYEGDVIGHYLTAYVAPGKYDVGSTFIKFYVDGGEITWIMREEMTFEEGGEYTFEVKVGKDKLHVLTDEVNITDYPDSWNSDSEENLNGEIAIGTSDDGKTGWAVGDQVFVTLTSDYFGAQTYVYTFDGNGWTFEDDCFYYLEDEVPTVTAIYAPCYEYDWWDKPLVLTNGMMLGMTEYLEADCAMDNWYSINVNFEGANRTYSRLRIAALPNQTLTATATDFTPAGATKAGTHTYTLTADDKGNAYLYGTFAEDATVTVKKGDVTLTSYTFTEATEANKSYVLEARPVIDGTLGGKSVATEADVDALVEQLKAYVDSGITTIIVTGSNPAIIEVDSIVMPAVSEAIYRLSGNGYYDENNPYNGKIDLILQDVTGIMEWEFYNAFALNSITLPKVTTVGDEAFQGCDYLKQITFGSVVTSIAQENGLTFVVGDKVGGCDLILNCGQMQVEDRYRPDLVVGVWFKPSWGGDVTWNSITLTHTGEVTYTPTADGTQHIATYSCCGATVGEPEDHTGGIATCTKQAICSACGANYGELGDHTLSYTASGNVITATCSENCGYTGTATVSAGNTTYNGTAQETATVAYSEGWMGGELTVSYANNTNAGTATASITVGEATASVEFTIAKAEVNLDTLVDPEFATGLVYNGTAQALVIKTGSVEGGTILYSLTYDGEYTSTIPVATEAGRYGVYWLIQGDENHEDILSPGWTQVIIAAKPGTDANVTLGEYDSVYSGTAKEPGIASVVVDGVTLEAGKDYDVSYENNVYAGTAKVVITFKGNYTGTVIETFTISKAPLTVTADSKTMCVDRDIPELTYTITGFVNGETEDVLIAKPVAETSADGRTIGTYDITPSGAEADNYSFNYVNGTLTVNMHEGPYTAVFNWPEDTSELYMYVGLNCVCGSEVDYAYVYGENFTIESETAATDCQTPGSVTYSVTVTLNGQEYTETKTYTILSENHVGEPVNGFCTACGGFEAAVWNEEEYLYEISNAGQLYWYAQYLNTTNAEIFAELTADIIIPENAPNWEPINASYVYFNGNFHTISGLKCIGGDRTYVGLFGNEIWWYEISNLHITDSYFEGKEYVGAVAACMSNGGSITNCAVTNTTVKGDDYKVGGLVGYLGSHVINCFSTATVEGKEGNAPIGYYSSYNGVIENCYFLGTEDDCEGTNAMTAEDFASGKVAFLLQSNVPEEDIYDEDWNYIGSEQPHVWGQEIGVGAYPVLGGDKVYEVTNCLNETVYSNTEVVGHTEETIPGYAADCVNPGLTDGVICTVCGETITAQKEIPAPGHSYEDDVCTVCGHIGVPVKLDSASLSFKEKIHYNIFFYLGIDETVDLSDIGLIMFDSLNAEGTMDDAIAVYSGAVEMDGKYMVATDGIHAKHMGDTIYFRVYAKLADGSYVYSKTVQYSAVTYAEHIFNSDKPESAKALVVAMLNYGAAAQMFFGYNTDNLVNTFLTEEQKALPEQYRDDMANAVPVVAAEKQGIFANNKGFNKRTPAVSFEGAFEINYFFTPAYAPVDGITLYYWTEADFEANEVLTVDNATGSLKLEGTGTEQYRGDIGGIAAKNLSENIYVAAVYSDGTTTWTSGVLGYSISAYCGRLATNGGTIADLAMATAVYGYHAKAYFG